MMGVLKFRFIYDNSCQHSQKSIVPHMSSIAIGVVLIFIVIPVLSVIIITKP